MSDSEQLTLDDVWVNRLAQRIGVLTAQNDRLALENEALTKRLDEYVARDQLGTNSTHEGVTA